MTCQELGMAGIWNVVECLVDLLGDQIGESVCKSKVGFLHRRGKVK